ncbi:hypothetical protein [Pseudomonas sp. 2FE]|uniref:hypothetical protein n=1 Tax=Pseudomonas sp. 2FE TaxID=2502190 RepID=UPI0010F4ABDC|nr:hypothetical protein [Pseudomonas sp. 2FE]
MRPSTIESLHESLAMWQEMKETGEGLAFMADEIIEEIQGKISSLEYLLGQLAIHGTGLTLKDSKRDAWGIVLPDASQAGRYRWQAFQRDGFTGHCTHDTPELCVGDMLDDGYTMVDLGALDRLATTVEWQRGMEVVAVIQACNTGLLSFEDAMRKREEIYARYSVAA